MAEKTQVTKVSVTDSDCRIREMYKQEVIPFLMKRFNYKAKEKATGKSIKGSIQAENEQTAGRLLIDQGYVPQSVVEEGEGLLGGKSRVTNKDRITFTRQLSTLIGAGLPLATSLRTVKVTGS